MKSISMIAALCVISGCVWNVDRPNPYEYERWSVPRQSAPVEIALLECGYPDIFGSAGYNFSDNDVVHAERCMRSYGYRQNDSYGAFLCKHKKNLTACSDGYTPYRSVEKRLSSPYCSKYTKSKYCR
jgi:hypothetical protein